MTAGQRRVLGALAAALLSWGCSEDVTGPQAGSGPGGAALAGKPSTFEFSFPFTEFNDCGSFTALRQGTESQSAKTYFDKDGNAVRSQGHARVRATHTNLATGEVVEEKGDYHFQFDFVTGEMVINGQFAMLTSAGEGAVVKDVGRVVVDADGDVVFSAGKHELFGENPAIVYCGAFSS